MVFLSYRFIELYKRKTCDKITIKRLMKCCIALSPTPVGCQSRGRYLLLTEIERCIAMRVARQQIHQSRIDKQYFFTNVHLSQNPEIAHQL